VRVDWTQPDSGGSAITGYRVYRHVDGQAPTLLATVSPTSARTYTDTSLPQCPLPSAPGAICYSYYVTAVNSAGESVACDGSYGEIRPQDGVITNACIAPGLTVATDASNDQTGGAASTGKDVDIQSVSIGEPYYADGSGKLVFTMKVADLRSLQPNRQWRIFWNTPAAISTGGIYYVGMNTDNNSQVTFEYGTAEVQVVGLVLGVPVTSRVGTPDAGTNYTPDGTITIVIDKSKVGSPKPGDLLGGILGRTFTLTGNTTTRSTTALDTAFASSYDGTYMVIGNAACKP
jgi:hypothetical protein